MTRGEVGDSLDDVTRLAHEFVAVALSEGLDANEMVGWIVEALEEQQETKFDDDWWSMAFCPKCGNDTIRECIASGKWTTSE